MMLVRDSSGVSRFWRVNLATGVLLCALNAPPVFSQDGYGRALPNETIMETLRKYYSTLPDSLLFNGKCVLLFLGVAAFYYIMSEAKSARISLRRLIAFVFPDKLRHQSTRPEIGDYLLRMVLWGPIYFALLGTLGTIATVDLVYGLMATQSGVQPALLQEPLAVVVAQFSIIFVTQELVAYANHYAWHKVPLLWAFHRIHHSAESSTVFSTARGHPIETLLIITGNIVAGGVAGVAFFLIGTKIQPGTVAAVALLDLVFGHCWLYLLHSRVRISFGVFAYVFHTPIMHQVHHSMEPRHRDKNLGSRVMALDWLFGTLYVPAKDEAMPWGLNENEVGPNNPHSRLRDYYLEPFRYARQVLRGTKPVTSLNPEVGAVSVPSRISVDVESSQVSRGSSPRCREGGTW